MNNLPSSSSSNFLIYTDTNGKVRIEVFIKDESVWLIQKAMAELFGVQVPAINKHVKNIFESGELNENSVVSILETTAADGKHYKTNCYNPVAIISVGYRVKSPHGTSKTCSMLIAEK